jgi:hypothetical protein
MLECRKEIVTAKEETDGVVVLASKTQVGCERVKERDSTYDCVVFEEGQHKKRH